jgi:hypothetical protein
VACRCFESSQQPTWPQLRQIRSSFQVPPTLKQSSQPLALGVTSRIWSKCGQRVIDAILIDRNITSCHRPSYKDFLY